MRHSGFKFDVQTCNSSRAATWIRKRSTIPNTLYSFDVLGIRIENGNNH
jgi:hypothetical protein